MKPTNIGHALGMLLLMSGALFCGALAAWHLGSGNYLSGAIWAAGLLVTAWSLAYEGAEHRFISDEPEDYERRTVVRRPVAVDEDDDQEVA